MGKKRVFSRELWRADRGYPKSVEDKFEFPALCDGLTAEECASIFFGRGFEFDEYDLKHCFKEVDA